MADEVLGITGVVNFDDIKTTFDGLISSLERVGVQTDELSAQMTKALADIANSADKDTSKAEAVLEALKQAIATTNKEFGSMPDAIKAAEEQIEKMQQACAKLEDKFENTPITSDEFEKVRTQLQKNKEALSAVITEHDNLISAQDEAQKSASSLQEQYDALAKSLNSVKQGSPTAEVQSPAPTSEVPTESTSSENTTEQLKEQAEAQREVAAAAREATIAKIEDNATNSFQSKSLKELKSDLKDAQLEYEQMKEAAKKSDAYKDYISNLNKLSTTKTALKNAQSMMNGADSNTSQQWLAQQQKLIDGYKKSIEELNKKIKDFKENSKDAQSLSAQEKYIQNLKDAINNFGSSAEKAKTPTAEYRALRNELIALKQEYNNLSEAEKEGARGDELRQKISEVTKETSDLKLQISATNKELLHSASPTQMFDGVASGLNLLISGFSTAQGAASALGLSEKDLAEVQTMLQTALSANNFLTEARTALLKSSSLMVTINTVQTWAAQKAIDAETAAKGRGVVATTALTVAQAAFNMVAKANPYVLLATALLTVVGAVAGLTIAYRSNKKASEEAQKAADERKAKLEAEQAANERFASTMADAAAEQIVSYQKLRREWSALGNDLNAKKKFIDENQDAFHDLGYSVNGVTDAENLLVNNTSAVVNAILLRAKAAAYEQRITDLTKEKIEKQELLQKREKFKAGDTVVNPQKIKGGLKEGVDYVKQSDRTIYSGTSISGTTYASTAEGGYTLTARGARRLNMGDNGRDNRKIEVDYNSKINGAVNELTSLEGQLAGTLKSIGVGQYTPPTKTTTHTTNTHRNNNTGDDNKDIIKAQEDLNKELASLRRKNEEDAIENLSDGRKKQLAEIEFAHKEEIDAVKEQAEKLAKLHKEARTSNADKTLTLGNGTTVSGLTQGDVDELSKSVANSEEKYNRSLEAIHQSELESMRNYLKEYGTLQQQRVALIEEWDKKIAEAQNEGDRLSAVQGKDQAVKEFDNNALKNGVDWEQMFGDVGNMSVEKMKSTKESLKEQLDNGDLDISDYKTIVEQIDKLNNAIVDSETKQNIFSGLITERAKERKKLEMEVAEAMEQQKKATNDLSAAQANLVTSRLSLNDKLSQYGMGQYAKADISSADAQQIISAATEKYGADSLQVKDLQEKLNALAVSSHDVSTAQDKLITSTNKLNNAQDKKKNQDKDKNFYEKYQETFDDISAYASSAQDFGKLIGGKAGETISALGQGVNSGISAVKDFASGNYLGALTNGLSAFKTVGTALFGDGNSDPELKEDIEKLNEQNENLSAAIDRLNDTMEEANMLQSNKIYEQQKEALAIQEKNTQEEMYRSATNYQKANVFHGHKTSSAGVINNTLSVSDWAKVTKAAGTSVNSAQDFFSLTSEQMRAVSTEQAALYEKIKLLADDGFNDAAQFMDTYIGYAKTADELADGFNEKLTNLSFDSLQSDFRNALLDMDSDAQDFTDNFQNYLNSAIIEGLMTSLYDSRLKTWWQKFSDYVGNDGTIDTKERDELMSDYQGIVDDALAKREELKNMGILKSTSDSQQSASYGSASNITQDQADTLVGLMTSEVWNGNQLLTYAIQQTTLMTTVQLDTTQIRLTQETIRGYVSELVDIQQDSLSNLQKIVVNTNPLPSMKETLENIYKKVKEI